MTNLSPAAQAVWNAAYNTPEDCPYEHDLAAALRAAADQVVPQRRKPMDADNWEEATWIAQQDTREELFAIAAELETQ
jgi:protein-disulfide isomerase